MPRRIYFTSAVHESATPFNSKPLPEIDLPAEKECRKCRVLLSVAAFSYGAARKKGGQCRDCARERGLRARFGISIEEYNVMLAAQGGKCYICKGDQVGNLSMGVDHDHATGKLRKLLCNHCNNMIGQSFDSPDRLRAGAVYLEEHALTHSL